METSTLDRTSRRWIGRLIRLGLVVLAIGLVVSWAGGRISRKTRSFRIDNTPVTDATLGPGDLRIFNRDSGVDLVLRGDRVLAGLSPKTIAKVQNEMAKSSSSDTAGIGGLIASTVKKTVSGAIGTHVAYPLSDIRDMRFEDGQLIIEKQSGGDTRLFGDAKVNNEESGKLFSREDAERFMNAVRARKSALRIP